MRHLDGTPRQAGVRFRGADMPTQGGQKPYKWPQMGIICATYPRDHARNLSKSHVECDVFLPRLSTPLHNVAVSFPFYGVADGMERHPRAPSMAVTLDPPDPVQIEKSDGDRVIVDFIAGLYPIIRGSLPRTSTSAPTFSPTSAQGDRMVFHHRGATVVVLETGEIQLTPAAGQVVKLGVVDGTEEFVPLTSLIVSMHNGHTHPAPGGATSPPTTPISAATIQGTRTKVK